MKLTLQIQALPSAEQAVALRDVMVAFNAAATHAATVGYAAKDFSQPGIHRRCYRELRERFGLSSQLAVRAIGKAVKAFQRDKTQAPTFRPTGAIIYDDRCFRFNGNAAASILTRSGRVIVPIACGDYQRRRFEQINGQVELVTAGGRFFLHALAEVPENETMAVTDFLGVDMGVVNIASTSDGRMFSGAEIDIVRVRRADRRRRLSRESTRQQKRGKRARSVRRAARRLGKKEARFRAYENHCISKQLAVLAQGTKRGIAVEDLRYIRSRIRFAKAQRARMGGWAFAQLQAFLAYKAKLRGVPFVVVNAAYTSQTCNACGDCRRENRPGQASFVCTACGHSANADVNAAQNIAARAVCNAATGLATPQKIAA